MKGELTKENFLKLLGLSGSAREGAGEMFDYFVGQEYSEFVRDEKTLSKYFEDRELNEFDPNHYGYGEARVVRGIFDSGFSFISILLSDNEDSREMAYNGFLTTISNDRRGIRQKDEDLYVIKEQR